MLDEKIKSIKEDLENFLLEVINNSKEKTNNNLFSNNPQYLFEINNILDNYNRNIFLLIDLEKYINYFKINEDDKEIINGIIIVLKAFRNNKFAKLPNDIRRSIQSNSIMKKYIEDLLNMKNDYEQYKAVPNQMQEILEYIQSLERNSYIEDLNKIFDIIRNIKIDLKIKRDISIKIAEYNIAVGQYMANYDYTEEEYVDKVFSYRVSYEDLKNILEKYGYNIEKLNEEILEKILLLGNINDIEYILQWYNKLELDIDIEKKTDDKYFHLLYRCDSKIIDRMEMISKELNIDIKKLLVKSLSAFMHKATKDMKKIKETNKKTNDSIQLIGSYEDFVANKNLLSDYGYDIVESYNKCPSIFIYSNKKLKSNIKALEKYGINVKENHDSIKLSGLKSTDILLTIDKFIELDEFDYIKNNTSRLQLGPDHVIFYRLYKAKKNNVDFRSNRQKGTYKSFITQDAIGKDFVSNDNKQCDTNTIIPNIFNESTRELLQQSYNISNSIISEEILDSEIIRKLDSLYLRDNQIVYYINNIRISRFKVIRLLSSLKDYIETLDINDLLLYCITYNSILNQAEFDSIKEKISLDFKEKGMS